MAQAAVEVAMSEMRCGRCGVEGHLHELGTCPDGGGTFTFTFTIHPEVAGWIVANPDAGSTEFIEWLLERARKKRAAPP